MIVGGVSLYNNDFTALNPHAVPTVKTDLNEPVTVKDLDGTVPLDCTTCASRTYQDGSNDPGVSFKTPTKIAPEASFAQVAGHEREHVSRNAAKASSEGKESVSTVRIFTATCPECGKTYAAGGETTTTTRSIERKQELNQHFYEKQFGPGADAVLDILL